MKYRTPTKSFPSSKATGTSDLPENEVWKRETVASKTHSLYSRNTSHSDERSPPTDHKALFLEVNTFWLRSQQQKQGM